MFFILPNSSPAPNFKPPTRKSDEIYSPGKTQPKRVATDGIAMNTEEALPGSSDAKVLFERWITDAVEMMWSEIQHQFYSRTYCPSWMQQQFRRTREAIQNYSSKTVLFLRIRFISLLCFFCLSLRS